MVHFNLYAFGSAGLCLACILSLSKTIFGKPNPLFYNEKLYFASISILLIVNKLCFFDAGVINIDEPIVLNGSRTLGQEPWPWISVDPTTWGPINFLPGIVLLKLASWASYGELRMLYVLICVIPSIGFFFFTIRKITNSLYARIAIIPLILTFVFLNQPDLVHASSEHIPLFLYSVVICTIILIANDHYPGSWQIFTAGFLCGASFFSKLQVTPLFYYLAFVCFVQLYFIKSRKKDAWMLAAGFVFCNAIALIAIFSYGGFADFVQSYIHGNLHYTARTQYVMEAAVGFILPAIGGMFPILLMALVAMGIMIYKLVNWLPKRVLWYHIAAIGLSAIAFVYLPHRAGHHLPVLILKIGIANLVLYLSVLSVMVMLILLRYVYGRNISDLFMYSGFALTVMITAYCIAKPGRYYLHYLMLLFLPVYAATIWILVKYVKTFRPVAVVSAIIVILFTQNILQSYRILNGSWLLKTPNDPQLLAYFSKNKLPNDRLAVWGWGSAYNHEAGLLMGTRDLHFEFQSSSTQPAFARYYQERYMSDLRKNKPRWLLDLSAPGGLLTYEKLMLVHFSKIDGYVQQNYREVYRSGFRVLYELKN